jgi:hypothetical protein
MWDGHGDIKARRGRPCERPVPVFFISVAAKGFSVVISSLFAALAETRISIAAKRVREWGMAGRERDVRRQRGNDVRDW